MKSHCGKKGKQRGSFPVHWEDDLVRTENQCHSPGFEEDVQFHPEKKVLRIKKGEKNPTATEYGRASFYEAFFQIGTVLPGEEV